MSEQESELEEALKSAEDNDDDVRWAAPLLAAEVRRLRGENATLNDGFSALDPHMRGYRDEAERLRGTIRAMSENEGKLQLQIANLQTALSRTESLCDMQHDDRLIRVADIRRALRGPE